MDRQTILIKEYIANAIIKQFEAEYDNFSSEDFGTVMLNKILALKAEQIAEVANISLNMAQKYKSASSLPPLETAVLLEEHFSIPAKFWIKYRDMKQGK